MGVQLPFIYQLSESMPKDVTSDDSAKKDDEQQSVISTVLMKDFEGNVKYNLLQCAGKFKKSLKNL